jgi:ABC-type transport system substrate-binding protein
MAQQGGSSDGTVNRRRILQGIGASGVAGLAGCQGNNGGGDVDKEESFERVEVNPEDLTQGGTLNVALPSKPKTFDPPNTTSTTGIILQNLMYEGLTTTTATGELYPWLARSYELKDLQDIERTAYADYMIEADTTSEGAVDIDRQIVIRHPDDNPAEQDTVRVLTVDEAGAAVDDGTYGMQFRYNLEEGVTFHNGNELTAEDVVASVRRWRNSNDAGQIYNSLLHARKIDKYTVDIYAQVPDAIAERSITPTVLPKELAELPKLDIDPVKDNDPIGTGPYEFDTYQPGQLFIAKRTDDYWLDVQEKFDTEAYSDLGIPEEWPDGPLIDTIRVEVIPDSATRNTGVQDGKQDFTWNLGAEKRNSFKKSDKYRVSAAEATGYVFIQYPVTVEPWDDKRFRQGINHMIPREQIVEDTFGGWVEPAWAPVPTPASETAAPDYEALKSELKEKNSFDIEKAEGKIRPVLDEKGIDAPYEVVFYVASNRPDRSNMTQLIADYMNERTDLLKATVKQDNFQKQVQRISSESFKDKGEVVVIGLGGGFDPHGYVKVTHHQENFPNCCNFQQINFPELNSNLDKARFGIEAVNDQALRKKTYADIMRQVVNLSANSYTHFSAETAVMKNRVKGFNNYPANQSILSYGLYEPVDGQITYLSDQDSYLDN